MPTCELLHISKWIREFPMLLVHSMKDRGTRLGTTVLTCAKDYFVKDL